MGCILVYSRCILTRVDDVIASMEVKLCFGAPEMFSASQNYLSVSYPPKSGGYDVFILQIPSLYAQVLCSE